MSRFDNIQPGHKFWTAYPFPQLGYAPGDYGNVIEVEFISYDGDKYVVVKLPDGQEGILKSGYIYDTIEQCFEEEYGD